MTVGKTGYGWTASNDPNVWGGNVTIKVGPKQTAFRMRRSLAKDGSDTYLADLWRFVLWEMERIEPSAEGKVPDEWSYYFKLNTNSPTSGNYSQHAGGMAFDWNATQHPNGTRQSTGFTAGQVTAIHALIKLCRNLIGWGGDFTRTVDPMHVEIANGTADTEGHNRIKAFVLEVVRPAFKADPARYGLPVPVVTPPVVVPATPTPETPVPWKFTATPGIALGPIEPAVLWQCGITNQATGEHLVAIATEDANSLFVRMSADGTTQLDSMKVLGTNAHQTQFGWLKDGTVTFSVNDSRGNDICALPYRAGTFKARSGRALHVGSDSPTQLMFSPTQKYAILREFNAGNQETYYRLLTADVLGSAPVDLSKSIGFPVVVTPNNIPTQGFGSYGELLFILKGGTDTVQNPNRRYLEVKSFKTGKHLFTQSLDAVGPQDVSVEPEGMDGADLWLKIGNGANRRLVKFFHNLADR
jgi:hypothetical protein